MTKTETPISDIMSKMTLEITITGLRRQRIRNEVGLWLIRLGARVIGVKTSMVLR